MPEARRTLLVVVAVVAVVAVGACQPREDEHLPPNFLVIDIDSLRADRVRPDSETAPHLAELARQGVVFTRAYTTSGWTMPALASLLTGRFPRVQQDRSLEARYLPSDDLTLPQILSLYGYTSAAFLGSTLASNLSDLDTRFAMVDRHPPNESGSAGPRPFGEAFDTWLEQAARPPWFALVHEIDLNLLEPPMDAAEAAACRGDTFARPVRRYRDLLHLARQVGTDRARSACIAQYDCGLGYYDRAVGRMLDALDGQGMRSNTVIVVLSNHGEDLFEHEGVDHGVLYDTVMRIPLVVVDPARSPSTMDHPVQTVDVAATILDRAGAQRPAGLEGRSLFDPQADREVLSLTDRDNASLLAGGYHLVKRTSSGDGAVRVNPWYEMYDLSADPQEKEDLLSAAPAGSGPASGAGGGTPYSPVEVVAELQQVRLETWIRTRAQATPPDTPAYSDEQRRVLQERGYWQYVVGRESPGDVSGATPTP